MWFTLRTVGLSSRRQTTMVALIILLQWALVWRAFRVDAAAFMKLGDKQREILRGNGEGLLVWANGRTSTGSMFWSLVNTLTQSVPHEHNAFRVNGVASVCNGEKEAFHGVHKKSFFPTPTALSFCQDFATYYGGIRLATHVMPNQVQAPDPESDQFTLKAIPYEDFFGLVRGKTKIRTVVVIVRQNELARLLSEYELHKRIEGNGHELNFLPNPQDLTARLDSSCHRLHTGAEVARGLGFRVIKIDFLDIVTKSCQVTKLLLKTWLRDNEHQSGPLIQRLACAMHKEHTDPHPDKLEDRIGRKLAEGWKAALNGSAFEWMLNTHATEWPKASPINNCTLLASDTHKFYM